MANKVTSAEVEKRINIVFELLLTETPRLSIVQYAAKNWNISVRQADYYLQRAKSYLRKKLEVNKEAVFNKSFRKLDYLYSEAFRQKQFNVCHAIKKTQLEMFDALKNHSAIDPKEVTFNVRLVDDDE